MKRLLAILVLILLCFSLTSCQVIKLLNYGITGELMEPIEGFSYGEEKGTFIYKGIKYIDVREINGDCRIATPWDYVLLGMRSNWPLFPATQYLAPPTDDPSFITNGHGTAVYLREDLYHSEIMYVLNDTSFEFNFEDNSHNRDNEEYSQSCCYRQNKREHLIARVSRKDVEIGLANSYEHADDKRNYRNYRDFA